MKPKFLSQLLVAILIQNILICPVLRPFKVLLFTLPNGTKIMTSRVAMLLLSAMAVSEALIVFMYLNHLTLLQGSAAQVTPAIVDDVKSITQFIRVSKLNTYYPSTKSRLTFFLKPSRVLNTFSQ